ncbi:MAG: 4-(cytidine 5'-diphospho)-2-C-methyl-D-erythritol kinase [Spirochaetes bacterium RBG_13_51_14]|nr:MAG: 4-(cytidine 5'-diphospho)-2-C-methyl-D-erythritol kinase [Spirochaetes bacterium RBG_13_51_14]
MAESIKAYAKINLHLEVLNRRDDGYHNIFSLMASVALHDLLKLEDISVRGSAGGIDIAVAVTNKGGSYGHVTDSIPAHENLIAKASTLYLERIGMNGTAAFSIKKNIPSGAGLGGGSSDAAAALKLFNGMFKKFNEFELAEIGSKIGADVPYCLRGGFAICRGKGEIVLPVPGKLPYWVLVVNDGIHIDTDKAYQALRRSGDIDRDQEAGIGKSTRLFAQALASGSIEVLKTAAVNDFEAPVFLQHPAIGQLKEMLYRHHADYAIMTGSGSSVIGLFSTKDKAVKAQTKLKEKYDEVILTRFV